MASSPAPKPLIDEVSRHERRFNALLSFTHSQTKAAACMLLAAVVSLLWANFGDHHAFAHFWHTEVTLGIGSHTASMSLHHVVNDIAMAVFFLFVGLEIKYEMTVGELTNIRQALLPVLAALGGVLVPIAIYMAFNATHPESFMGWGVPTATDIAFALGIMALLGNRVPVGLRIFLSTLAVADDIIAIVVIAIFYGAAPNFLWLGAAAVVFAILIAMNRRHVYALAPYLLLGVVLWVCVFSSGVHATIAGVLLAFAIPNGSRVQLGEFMNWAGGKLQGAHNLYSPDEPVVSQKGYLQNISDIAAVSKQIVPPAVRLEHMLVGWVNFLVLPLFALANADVVVSGGIGASLGSPAFLGVFLGLLVGKPVGIFLMSFLVVKLGFSRLPDRVTWTHIASAGILGGLGFTMAIFVANLAFSTQELTDTAKLAILSASFVAGIVGYVLLLVASRKHPANADADAAATASGSADAAKREGGSDAPAAGASKREGGSDAPAAGASGDAAPATLPDGEPVMWDGAVEQPVPEQPRA